MIEFLNCIEEFAKNYKHTFSALGAIGTLLAVIVALYLSNKQNKSKINALVHKAKITNNFLIGDAISEIYDSVEGEEYLVVNIRNIGLSPVTIPYQFQFISIPFCKYEGEDTNISILAYISKKFNIPIWNAKTIIPNILDSSKKQFPICIASKNSEKITVSTIEDLLGYLKGLSSLQLHFMKWIVMTSDKMYRAKLSSALISDIYNAKNSSRETQ